MRSKAILKYEWINFTRSPFKVAALILFVLAAVYGLHNASKLYHTQLSEIERIKSQAESAQSENMAYYDANKKGPDSSPWVDLSEPFWAMWNTNAYHFKVPSPLIVYGIGQAEQFGYYKRVTFLSSPYDADMAEEIANPERLQTGYLDFAFAVIYLLPLLLIICLYDVKGAEVDNGIYPLISVQVISTRQWLWLRIGFYSILISTTVLVLLLYGGILTSVFNNNSNGFVLIFTWSLLYLLMWVLIIGFIIQLGSFSMSNTLKMVGVWLLLTFIVPGAIHQWVSTQHPANLMTDFIDAQRDERSALQALPDEEIQQQLNQLYPSILESPAMKDSLKQSAARRDSYAALYNILNKEGINAIETVISEKNKTTMHLNWINPVTYFQNRFNYLTKTHFDDYQKYRNDIQSLIDKQIQLMVMDTWNAKKVDKETYLNYIKVVHGNTK